MKEVVFSELAKLDLETIAAYGAKYWGSVEYFEGLGEACLQLSAMHPVLARPVPRHPLLKRVHWEDHYIIYRESELQIEIVRILHTKMDPRRHL
jgi:plasmid stabilization system protein ParE